MPEPFVNRVQLLRDSWLERRQVGRFAASHDFDSQFRLLITLHEWAEEAVRAAASVYEGSPGIIASPRPHRSETAAFSVTVGDRHSVTFALTERRRMSGARWHVSVSIAAQGPGGAVTQAGPERRNGQWSRARLEEVLLSLLGAYERSIEGSDAGSAARPAPGQTANGVA
ncbi:MAG: hypothetical protein ACKVT1_01060 [Dehalococcoidia bacterium]